MVSLSKKLFIVCLVSIVLTLPFGVSARVAVSPLDTLPNDPFAQTSNPELRHAFSISGYSPSDRFSQPEGIAIDERSRIIYVADTAKGRVVGFNRQGMAKFNFKVPGIEYPSRMAVNKDGNLFVADRELPIIKVLDSQGKQVRQINLADLGLGEGVRVSGITFSEKGLLYIADGGNNQILTVDSTTGRLIASFGEVGEREGQLKKVEGVALDRKGRIYVLDSVGTVVNVFDPTGKFITRFGQITGADNDFRLPSAIYIDRNDQLWITDVEANVVWVYSASGALLRRFGDFGLSTGTFFSPVAITMDSIGNLYVLERDSSRVQVFSLRNPFFPFSL